MSWLTKIFGEPADCRMCGTVKAEYYTELKPAHPDYNFNNPEKNKIDRWLTYYLYEDQDGNRKFEVIDSHRGELDLKGNKRDVYRRVVPIIPKDDILYRMDIYRDKIRPWLDGRYDPDIGDYETTPKDDFQNRLAKKKVK